MRRGVTAKTPGPHGYQISETTDPRVAQTQVSRHIWPQALKLRTNGFRVRLEHARLFGGAGLTHLSYGDAEVTSTWTSPHRQAVVVHLPVAGTVETCVGRHRVTTAAGRDIAVTQPSQVTMEHWSPRASKLLMTFDLPMLRDLFWQMTGVRPTLESLRFAPTQPLTGSIRGWVDLVHAVYRSSSMGRGIPIHPITTRYVTHMLGSGFLLSASHAYSELLRDGKYHGPENLRRIMKYVDEHAHLGIRAQDIAAGTGIPDRTVHRVCWRYMKQTPGEFLLEVRLERARADLLAADPEDVQISDIANRYGYTSVSRFTARYRQRYDESPSMTVKRRAEELRADCAHLFTSTSTSGGDGVGTASPAGGQQSAEDRRRVAPSQARARISAA